jgi:fused signal recognition particle receptor
MVFDFLKSKLAKQTPDSPDNTGIFAKLKHKIKIFFANDTLIDEEFFTNLEEILLKADLGLETTEQVLAKVKLQHKKHRCTQIPEVIDLLKKELLQIIAPLEQPLEVSAKTPYIILVIGVNGAGKTTTIGKLARKYVLEGKKVMLAAGDTYRAAAIQQLDNWGQQNHVPVIKQEHGADSASVIFDAIQSARAQKYRCLNCRHSWQITYSRQFNE